MSEIPKYRRLSELTQDIGYAIYSEPKLQHQWIVAEINGLSISRGHCYFDLVEKESTHGSIVAKMRGIIWASRFPQLRYKFESATGQALANGIKVMLQVNVTWNSQYGISLVADDIFPQFTLGDIEIRRQEIIARLKAEGLYDLNRELCLPIVAQRIAVVSAATAAGYGDFMNQLRGNQLGVNFHTTLFPAVLQGEQCAPSVIAALDDIAARAEQFDCVVIIRGGGAAIDLMGFDDYELAARVARFPLPVITGIGHERDNTILDLISCRRVKTPTAAAEYLIAQAEEFVARLADCASRIATAAREIMAASKEQLSALQSQLPHVPTIITQRAALKLRALAASIPGDAAKRISIERTALAATTSILRASLARRSEIETMKLDAIASKVELLSPEATLKRGYSITRLNGRAVTSISRVKPGDVITTILPDGEFSSQVTR